MTESNILATFWELSSNLCEALVEVVCISEIYQFLEGYCVGKMESTILSFCNRVASRTEFVKVYFKTSLILICVHHT